MPFILIKNNLKLMLRNKWILFIMILLPLITVALLSNAFKDMLDTAHKIGEFQAGCRIDESSVYRDMLPELKAVCQENGVILKEYPDGDIPELVKTGTVAVFADIGESSYTIYQSSDKKMEAAVTESIFSSFFYQVNTGMTKAVYEAGPERQAAKGGMAVKSEKLATEPVPSSVDYYGIVYIVYGTWCGMAVLVAVVSGERKGAVLQRMRVAHMFRLKHYIGKFIPAALAIFIEVGLAWLLSVALFGIRWGNIGMSVLIVFLTSMAAAAFGIVLFQLFSNTAVSIVIGFALIWIAGFFGGTFQSYMYSLLPDRLVRISPLYHIDRTLVEYSTKGGSDYTVGCILFLSAIILVFGLFGTLLISRKMEEQ
jgi:ABC-2 type transport system permease protein